VRDVAALLLVASMPICAGAVRDSTATWPRAFLAVLAVCAVVFLLCALLCFNSARTLLLPPCHAALYAAAYAVGRGQGSCMFMSSRMHVCEWYPPKRSTAC
jgi:hypothetical protein